MVSRSTVIETGRDAMSEPHETTIITDGISDEEKTTPEFQSFYRDMRAQLCAPGFIPVLCAHEAAHMAYFTLAGVKNFEPTPSQIRYDPTIGGYTAELAAVRPLDLPTWIEGQFGDWLFKIARAHAAGGVVARRLLPSSDGGDNGDKEQFKDVCDYITNNDPNVRIDFEKVWKEAQDSIGKDLENAEWLATIQREAEILRPHLGL
jgi:hypothetical protein